jgi:hypothetical protein
MSRERIAKSVGADAFGEARSARSSPYGLVDDAGVDVVAACDAGSWILGKVTRRKYVLPAPLFAGMRKLAGQPVRQKDFAVTLSQVLLVESLDFGQVALKKRSQAGWIGGDSVLVSFAGTHGDLLHSKVHVFDPEPNGLHDPQAAAIEEFGDKLRCPVEQGKGPSQLPPGSSPLGPWPSCRHGWR